MPATSSTPLTDARLHLVEVEGMSLLLEGHHPGGGSIKARLVAHLLAGARRADRWSPGQGLVEMSPGNTALALACFGRQHGSPVELIVPDTMSPAQQAAIRSAGGRLHILPAAAGPPGAMAHIAARQAEGWHWLNQYTDPAAPGAYTALAERLLAARPQTDALVAAVGTGSTLTGMGRVLRAQRPGARLIAVEPAPGAAIPGLRNTRLQHMGPAERYDRDLPDQTVEVTAEQARSGCAQLRRAGVQASLCGGAVLHAAQQLDAQHPLLVLADATAAAPG